MGKQKKDARSNSGSEKSADADIAEKSSEKYKPEYCQQLIDYFSRDSLELIHESSSNGKKTLRRLPAKMPWFEGFAREIGVHRNTLANWRKAYPEFNKAYETSKDLQREILVDIGLSGTVSPSFAIFTMKNVCGWRDERDLRLKQEKENKIDDDELEEALFG